ncbi:kinesin-like nuclear fusion protein [Coemansia sp. Benny D115]|nr:kinesin-like nuclear fusion protein [Coemansia sp. Benny D115]
MARHHRDLMFCRRLPGTAIGRLCEKCDGKCVICDSLVRPEKIVHICDECNFGNFQSQCIICNGKGISDAYYCSECVELENDRDGCPKIVNTTGLRIPGSMIKPPSKIGGFTKSTSATPAFNIEAAHGKRKATENGENGVRPASAAEVRGQGHGKQQTKTPVSRIAKPSAVETVHAGRRSSQGFTVAPRDMTVSAIGLPRPSMAPAGRPVVPKATAGAPGRMAASRTSATRGRVNISKISSTGRGAAPSTVDGIKRRRLDMPSALKSLAGKQSAPSTGNKSQKPSDKVLGHSVLGKKADEDEGDNDDDDDDDDNDSELGPPPALHNRHESDINGRLKDLEEFSLYMIKKNRTARKTKKLLSVELEQNSTQVMQLEFDKNILSAKLEEAEKKANKLQKAVEERQQALREERNKQDDEMAEMRRQFKRQEEQLQEEQRALKRSVSELQDQLETTEGRLKSKREECVRLEDTISKQASAQLELESSYRMAKAKVEQLEDTVSQREARIAELEETLSARNQLVEELEAKLRVEESTRRRLHNTIQELKGNIRVFCRVRPLSVEEKDAADALPIKLPESEERNEIELTQVSENALGKATSKVFPFKFDRVFEPEASQGAVFDEVSQLIQSALDGYPVCIFAYGQTGSGKTHTMQGPDSLDARASAENREILGIIPRAVQQIYDNTSRLAERGWEYELEGQFLEIYNETLQDLLAPTQRGSSGDKHGAAGNGGKLEIYQDGEGHTRVKNLTTVKVDSAERVHWLLARAAENRTVAATNCNERSSRSHSVFTLHLRGKNSLTGEVSSGTLNLIDLAGSERLSSSGSVGERLKETQAINKSLASLGDVIAALAKGSRHVPYRNSKLTHLLQESLGGNSKTLMFVCVNPSPSSTQESLCSLQFATKVNSCQIGTARRQAPA